MQCNQHRYNLCGRYACEGSGKSQEGKENLSCEKGARFYDELLKEEINADRIAHGKKPLKEKEESSDSDKDENKHEDDGDTPSGPRAEVPADMKECKQSTTDEESGWFHKGEHKSVFAYSVESACDENGWMLGYSVHPGNENDSKTFPYLYEKLKNFFPSVICMDAGYKTPAIAKLLIDDKIKPLFPYTRPMTKKGFLKKYEYAYDEYYDCYICPNNKVLKYSTTNRDGYREYKSDGRICESCPYLKQCTLSKNHEKLITRHIWEDYIEACEDIRHTVGMKELYGKRKETIERNFGTAKEHMGMRYTQMTGKEKMSMKIGLTFACLNMKKLVKILELRDKNTSAFGSFFKKFTNCLKYAPKLLIA